MQERVALSEKELAESREAYQDAEKRNDRLQRERTRLAAELVEAKAKTSLAVADAISAAEKKFAEVLPLHAADNLIRLMSNRHKLMEHLPQTPLSTQKPCILQNQERQRYLAWNLASLPSSRAWIQQTCSWLRFKARIPMPWILSALSTNP